MSLPEPPCIVPLAELPIDFRLWLLQKLKGMLFEEGWYARARGHFDENGRFTSIVIDEMRFNYVRGGLRLHTDA